MTINEYITVVISIVAIIISIIVFIDNSKKDKRHIRIGRLEEIIEIIHILYLHYHEFENAYFLKLDLFKDGIYDLKKIDKKDVRFYKSFLKSVSKTYNEIDVKKRLSRLYVLSNSYLPNKELKDKIKIFGEIYGSLVIYVIEYPFNNAEYTFTEFRTKDDLQDYYLEIQNELVKEMGLGFKKSVSFENKYKSKFLERYKLK